MISFCFFKDRALAGVDRELFIRAVCHFGAVAHTAMEDRAREPKLVSYYAPVARSEPIFFEMTLQQRYTAVALVAETVLDREKAIAGELAVWHELTARAIWLSLCLPVAMELASRQMRKEGREAPFDNSPTLSLLQDWLLESHKSSDFKYASGRIPSLDSPRDDWIEVVEDIADDFADDLDWHMDNLTLADLVHGPDAWCAAPPTGSSEDVARATAIYEALLVENPEAQLR